MMIVLRPGVGSRFFSGDDGKNTHFIGHNPGLFAGVWQSNKYYVADSLGVIHKYINTKVYKVNEKGIGEEV